jgi:hypothetical protein
VNAVGCQDSGGASPIDKYEVVWSATLHFDRLDLSMVNILTVDMVWSTLCYDDPHWIVDIFKSSFLMVEYLRQSFFHGHFGS